MVLAKTNRGGFRDKKILVVGLARSGVGAANLLSSFGAKVWVTDIKSREFLEDRISKLLPSIKVVTGEYPDEIFNTADMIVVSPGVPLDIPPLTNAKASGVQIIGELELAYQVVKKSEGKEWSEAGKGTDGLSLSVSSPSVPAFIGITGTNGKSTVTALTDMMLKESNFKTIMGGNIGNALTEELYKLIVNNEGLESDYIVAEISSFQLESIQDFEPFVALILNITPDHFDRYSGIQQYIDAKAKIFKNQGPGDYLIVNADDPVVMEMYNAKCKVKNANLSNVKTLFFSRKKEVEGIYYKNGSLHCSFLSTPGTVPRDFLRKQERGTVSSPFELIAVDKIKVKGVHNIENAMAASLAALICGCSVDDVRNVLERFSGLEHRLEFVRSVNGVNFINDSKGTNIGAVVKSLESLENIVLIMGGRDKDGDFSVLRDLIKEKVKALVLLGEALDKIAEAVGDVVETVSVSDMDEAVEMSMSKSSAGDVVLLSPGCASFDMFQDFEDRGRKFKEAVKRVRN